MDGSTNHYTKRLCPRASLAKNTPPALFKKDSSLGVLSTLFRKSKKALEIMLTDFAVVVG